MTSSTLTNPTFFGALRNEPGELDRLAKETASLGWTFLGKAPKEIPLSGAVSFFCSLQDLSLKQLLSARLLNSPEILVLLQEGRRLVATLPPGTTRRLETVREVRGNVNWQATVLQQITRGDKGALVVSRNTARQDTVEAKLTAFALNEVLESNRSASLSSADVENSVAEILGHARLMNVQLLADVSMHDLRRARRSRHRGFRNLVLPAVELLLEAKRSPAELLEKMLGKNAWVPEDPATLFELWWLFSVANCLTEQGWLIEELRSTVSKGPAFSLSCGEDVVRLFYQRLPSSLSSSNRYQEVQRANGLLASQRRPDIILQKVKASGETVSVILEVKLSENPRYITEGIYKVFGYLFDYSKLAEANSARGFVLVWSTEGTPNFESVVTVLSARNFPDYSSSFLHFISKL